MSEYLVVSQITQQRETFEADSDETASDIVRTKLLGLAGENVTLYKAVRWYIPSSHKEVKKG